MKSFNGLSLSLTALLLLVLAAPAGFADGNTTIQNNGPTPVFVRVKNNDGSYGKPLILPPGVGGGASTADLPADASRIRVNTLGEGKLNVQINKPDGNHIKLDNTQQGKSVVLDPVPGGVAQRFSEGIEYTPQIGIGELKMTAGLNYKGQPFGIGLGPAASDGPAIWAGYPSVNHRLKWPGSKLTWAGVMDDWDLTEGDVDDIMAEFPEVKTPEDLEEFLEEEDAFYYYFSGSGSGFGDCVGTRCQIGVAFPGFPSGGQTIGSSIHFDRSMVLRITNDLTLLDPVNFEAEFNAKPTEDRFGSHFNN